ncbi:aminoacyl tRNA synthase complex-interacting multifunctional protein 1-like isoform X2 [Agrilus planipennis]|uniref:Aminoacyl tRNA synthase complex-interacting multifunctional protein 1-like isoform X2 n=1 Tax=Agrilus planipennis TaxID=224129 RepID=A0A7F5RN94_AGRPL|nr:aminoacyl tRNA synthase complex-interacting multifunctional protein 1-like isoform X2 [Agrilus planipennis]
MVKLFQLNLTLGTSLYLYRMSKTILDRIIFNAREAETTITELTSEIKSLTNEYNKIRIGKLLEENAKLENEVELAKRKLINLEQRNGINQVSLPISRTSISLEDKSNIQKDNNINIQLVKKIENVPMEQDTKAEGSTEKKPKKEKKPKEKQTQIELPINFGRLDLRIGKIENVERHPDADSLYVLKINCGEEKPRTVCSGLVKHVPLEQLKDASVVVLCNLKPVKMRGVTSEAMVMCASSPESVEVLIPPSGAVPGDPVECDGYNRSPDPIMNPKKKIFETVAPDLHTNDLLQACYKNTPWKIPVAGSGLLSMVVVI